MLRYAQSPSREITTFRRCKLLDQVVGRPIRCWPSWLAQTDKSKEGGREEGKGLSTQSIPTSIEPTLSALIEREERIREEKCRCVVVFNRVAKFMNRPLDFGSLGRRAACNHELCRVLHGGVIRNTNSDRHRQPGQLIHKSPGSAALRHLDPGPSAWPWGFRHERSLVRCLILSAD